jgi:hypothetical protein
MLPLVSVQAPGSGRIVHTIHAVHDANEEYLVYVSGTESRKSMAWTYQVPQCNTLGNEPKSQYESTHAQD